MTKTLSVVAILISALLPGLASGQAVDLTKAVGELTDRLVALSKGDVVGVEGETLYLSLGQKDGILEGNTFEVVRLGEQLKGGMRKETIVGEVAIIRVREQGSIAKVTHKSEEIKEGDQVYQLRKQVARVAVTEFPFDDKFNNLTRNVQDMLYTNLIQKGMRVVEREKLEEVLREQKAGFSGVLDLATAAQVGKLLGVEAVLVGSVADLGDALSVIARLVDVEKGVALTAARASVVKSPTLIDLLNKGPRPIRLGAAEAPAAEKGASTAASTGDVSPAKAGQTYKLPFENKVYENKQVVFKLVACELLEDRRLQCDFVYRNKLDGIIDVYFDKDVGRSFVIDNLGNVSGLIMSTPLLLNKGQPAPPGVDIAGSMTWEKVDERASSLNFTIGLQSGCCSAYSMFFPNIPLKESAKAPGKTTSKSR